MIYEKSLAIPKSTPASSPTTGTIPVHPGVLKQVDIDFPAGCVGLVHIVIRYRERQVFPANPDSSFTGDDVHLVFPEDMDLTDVPYEFTVHGWNEDDTYAHTPIVRMQIIPHDRGVGAVLSMLVVGRGSLVSGTGEGG